MSHFLERMVWMPSPPLAPDCGPADPAIDLVHLGRMTLGDAELKREVLAMFAAQAADLAERLTKIPPDAANLAHTLKGSARAIGASRVAEAAADVEAAVRAGAVTAVPVAALHDAIVEVRGVIDAILRRF
jgi:HPt (histidine-containing phosphotransfer) domain-containing protein